MRAMAIILACIGISACSSEPANQTGPTIESKPAAMSFEGAAGTGSAARLAHGKRLAIVLGCQGCHGDDYTGTNVTKDDPNFGDMNAPNLTLLVPTYSDAELERVIRRGVPKDEREFWFMPSESYQFLSDSDLAALIAYLRTLKPHGMQMPPIRIGEGLRQQSADGILVSSQGMNRRYRQQPPPELGEQHAYGRRLSQIVCAECHNSSLQGFGEFTPNLDLAGAYSAAELETLLTTGKGKSKPDLGLMALASRTRFTKLTPNERNAIVNYVLARANRPQ